MKQDSFGAFLVKLLLLSGIVYGSLFLVFTRFVTVQGMPLELIVSVLFAATAISHYIVMEASKKDHNVFTRSYMGISSTRLIVYSIFILIYCFKHKEIAKEFVLTFFVCYIVYTIFEVRSVQAFFKKK